MCRLICELLDLGADGLRGRAGLVDAARSLLTAANNDVNFAHTSLSLAWDLEEILP